MLILCTGSRALFLRAGTLITLQEVMNRKGRLGGEGSSPSPAERRT